jgi:hypothetical protein
MIISYVLWGAILLVLMFITFQSHHLIKKIKIDNDKNSPIVQSKVCDYDLLSLPVLSNSNTVCCKSAEDGLRLFTLTEESVTHSFVISNEQTPYTQACSSACNNGLADGKCVDGDGQSNYDYCLLKTQPVGCKDIETPIAIKNGIPWYVKMYSSSSCSVTTPCVDLTPSSPTTI